MFKVIRENEKKEKFSIVSKKTDNQMNQNNEYKILLDEHTLLQADLTTALLQKQKALAENVNMNKEIYDLRTRIKIFEDEKRIAIPTSNYINA